MAQNNITQSRCKVMRSQKLKKKVVLPKNCIHLYIDCAKTHINIVIPYILKKS